MSRTPWTAADIPDQSGRVAVITGANSGIGLETARELGRRGARVILGCRSPDKAAAAMETIRSSVPDAQLEPRSLDLADLSSVRAFAADTAAAHPQIHLLINNAGVMAIPLARTGDGFELQLGTNHLGHFALTALLWAGLRAAGAARIVTVSSLAHRYCKTIDLEDLNGQRRYSRVGAYCRSKLANLLFTLELQRRVEAAGLDLLAVAAHPGWTATNLQAHSGFISFFNPLLAMDSAQGALPTLRAATDPRVKGGDYYGPDGLLELRGWPVRVEMSAQARDAELARALWEQSEALTGAPFRI